MEHAAATLDLGAVERWLVGHMPGFAGPVSAQKFAGGQSNPTFRLDTPGASYVLRRKPPGELLKSAHAVDREFRVQQALAGTAVPVAAMHVLCEDDSVIGSSFYVMDHVPGRNFNDPRLPEVPVSERGAIVDEMNRVLAAIHMVDVEAAGLSDYGRPGNYYARQIDRWTRQYRASETERIAPMEELIDWLGAHGPQDDGRVTLVHGDYRIDNMLFAEDGPSCAAVLDWELSTLGHPFADLAGLLMQWRMPAGAEGRGLAGVDRAAEGLPSDEAFVARYFERTGFPRPASLNAHLAFAFFRMAAILQGVKKRGLDGNASNPERAARMGRFVPNFAEGGMEAAHNG